VYKGEIGYLSGELVQLPLVVDSRGVAQCPGASRTRHLGMNQG
jgi:hypothetical protein